MFYLLLVQKFNNETTAKALYEYPTMDDAKRALFSEMFSGMSKQNMTAIMCEIINESGSVLKHERWERVPESVVGTEN